MTRYLSSFTVPVAFEADAATDTLGKTLADHGLRQLRVAESYKYAHVTSFFNGYREDPYENEYRVIIPSDATPHPDLHPELRARDITDRVVAAIGERSYDFILVNYSNPDTIAHTGNYEASLQAVRVIDAELGRLVEANRAAEGILIITGDHGNIEELMNPQTGEVETQHDDNPVPFILVGSEWKGKHFGNQEHLRNETSGILADVAPTILALLGIPQPPEMTGRSLLGEIR
jgi:2,3-bisphosphoglycerate-independent phosphoglycerate mutase